MASKTGMKPTAERIRELYSYDKDTGIFSRRTAARKWGGLRRRGTIGAGSVSTHGYVMIAVDGTNYIAGNVAWAYVHGEWPRGRIRYRNGNKADNRFDNLLVVGDGQDVLQSRRLTVERLKELLHYEPTTGWFTWRVASTIAAVGERAGGFMVTAIV